MSGPAREPRRSSHGVPPEFTLGLATSSYQIEGAVTEDGRGPSIWDDFCRVPGKVVRGEHGDVAADHYHRWRDDVALLAALNAHAYRFSVAWPRVLPTGRGPVNAKGLAFYDRLVDGLLEAGVTPWLTLYHWDLPSALQAEGGWTARSTVDAFVDYADVMARALGDRVKHWITHNEPWCVAHLGHQTGEHAPGVRDPYLSLVAAHHVLLSHGRAVAPICAASPGAKVGITLNLTPGVPASPSAADADATRRFDGFFNRWYLDPIFGRGYPEDAVRDRLEDGHLPCATLPFVQPGDLDAIAVPTDFLGINYYSRAILRSDRVPEGHNAPVTVTAAPDPTDMGWELAPHALRDLLVRLATEYPAIPLSITENGAAYGDGPDAAGVIDDARRVAYLRTHLAACQEAIAAGAPLMSYFAWSFLDNFEWAYGYDKRFGLVHVDYATQVRTPKRSARWYAEVCHTRRLPGVDRG